MKHLRIRVLCLSSLLLSCAAFLASAAFSQQRDSPSAIQQSTVLLSDALQSDVQQSDDAGVIKVDVSVVNVLCTVRDGKGRLISNLQRADFELREDGKPQQIRYFTQETKLPLTLGLLVDSSVSQQRLIPEERRAAAAFFEQVLGKQDAAFLMSFDVNVDLLQDLTGSVDFLRRALGEIRINGGGGRQGPFPSVRGGGTHLYDAIYLAAREVLATEVGRKALILISDGQDQGSRVKREAAIEAAQRNDAILYGILFVDRGFYGRRGSFGYSGESTLKKLAEETGGRVFNIRSEKDLSGAFEQISSELRSQYSLGYTPTNAARDGSFRKIQVKATRRGLRVRARKGYYAPTGG